MAYNTPQTVFIDASFYLSLLNADDSCHQQALEQAVNYADFQYITSQAVLGEVLTVGSQRYDRHRTIDFVEEIRSSDTDIVLETPDLVRSAFDIFCTLSNKNISWVDCYSFAIMKSFRVDQSLSFDRDFRKFALV